MSIPNLRTCWVITEHERGRKWILRHSILKFGTRSGIYIRDTGTYDEAQESGHKETIQEAEQQFKKMVQSTELPEVKPSAAAEYAQKYSAHMNPKVNEAQAKFMQPNTDVKTRRAPRPAERPDISLDMNVSNASQYAKLASEKAFMNAAKLIDNSAELSEDKSPVTI